MSYDKVFLRGNLLDDADVIHDLGRSTYDVLIMDDSQSFCLNVGKGKPVICRCVNEKQYSSFNKRFKHNDFINVLGYLTNNKGNEYHNNVEVKFCTHAKSNELKEDLVLISGQVSDSSGGFKDIIVGSNNIDIYDKENNLSIGDNVALSGYAQISTYLNQKSDNYVFVEQYYDDSNYDKFLSLKSKLELWISKEKESYKTNNNVVYKESKIFNNFHNITKYNRLSYLDQDIINFHTAMKNKGLVILSGPSGTGKTELVRCYAEALGLLKPAHKELTNPQYLHISVSPSWTDDTDLLGYFNTEKGYYCPSDTGLVNLLYDASKKPNKLYIVLFDEMNLSHIEYYFSQFLSVLELPEEDPNRCIHLYDKSYEKEVFSNKANNHPEYPSSIPIHNNVLFVGTINIDGSTKQITNKVLDRSNVININSYTFESALFKSKDKKDLNELLHKIKPVTTSQFNSTKNESKNNSLSKDSGLIRRLILTDLNRLLKLTTYDRREIGYREVNQINEYLCDLPKDTDTIVSNYMNRYHKNDNYKTYSDVAFDYQLSQRILDKLSGSKYELYVFISILYDCMNGTNHFNPDQELPFDAHDLNKIKSIKNELSKIFTRNKIPYNYSDKIIRRKWAELRYYGFTR